MQQQSSLFNSTAQPHASQSHPWKKKRANWVGVVLLLSMAWGGFAAVNSLVPKVPGRAQGLASRLAWYRDSGQLKADLDSLDACYNYIMDVDYDTPAPVAGLPQS